MSSKWTFGILGAGLVLAFAWLYGALAGLAGVGIGLAGGLFSAGALWLAISQMGAAAKQGRAPASGIALSFIAIGMKVPLLLFSAGLSRKLGDAAFDCFLAGFMLVYFGLIGWAATRPTDGPSASDGHSTV